MASTRPTQDQLLGWMKSLSNWGRWGDKDELGTLNHLTPARTKAAVDLVREGVTVTCSRPVVWEGGPNLRVQPHHFMVMTGEPYRPGDGGPDRQVAMDYFGLVFHGHSITHLDSLAHFFWDGRMYNGHPSTQVTAGEGAKMESVDLVKKGIVTRGVLVDAPYLRGVDWLESPDGVGMADIEAAEARCGFKVEPGDVLLMRTGQLRKWNEKGVQHVAAGGSTGPLPEILPFMHSRGRRHGLRYRQRRDSDRLPPIHQPGPPGRDRRPRTVDPGQRRPRRPCAGVPGTEALAVPDQHPAAQADQHDRLSVQSDRGVLRTGSGPRYSISASTWPLLTASPAATCTALTVHSRGAAMVSSIFIDSITQIGWPRTR